MTFASHDERIAAANRLMRQRIAPALPPGEGAVLLIFDTSGDGLLTYISNCHREDMRKLLRAVLAKWDADAAASPTKEGTQG